MSKKVKAIAVLNSPKCKGTNISEVDKGGLLFEID